MIQRIAMAMHCTVTCEIFCLNKTSMFRIMFSITECNLLCSRISPNGRRSLRFSDDANYQGIR